jgi:hypothetical protein
MSVNEAFSRLRAAELVWNNALDDHQLAPPDAGYARRLEQLAKAAAAQQSSYEYAAEQGLGWTPSPGGEYLLPHELRPDSGRRGPQALWARFDRAASELDKALHGDSVSAIAAAFGELSAAAGELAGSVAEADTGTARAARQS